MTNHQVFIADSYGQGWDPDPLHAGEVLYDANGWDATIVGVTDDGKQLLVERNGKTEHCDPEFFSCKIEPTTQGA